ncbi:MAG: 23S rRNA (uracil(1939)-C(5))-methyltransferase RlmD [bacterium]
MVLHLPDTLSRTVTPRCVHFGECGGCTLQDVPYEDQLAAKAAEVGRLIGRTIEIVPSPDPYAYRHRMDYIIAFGKVGLRKRGDGRSVVDLKECHLVQPRVARVMNAVRKWIEELGIDTYDLVTKRGDLRYLTFRHAFSTDQLMAIVVTASEESGVEPLLDRLAAECESVVWSIQPRVGDTSVGVIHGIIGTETILQHIRGREFLISPNAFFQNNLLLVDTMFDCVAEHVRGFTLDLFCGLGAIGISVADRAERLMGVEVFEENIRLARINAEWNGVVAEFVHDNANHFLAFYDGPVPDTVVIDPPRSGLTPKLIRKLVRLGAERIVYVSCNPSSFADDLAALDGYELAEAVAYDMFPQTPHVEMVTLLEKR